MKKIYAFAAVAMMALAANAQNGAPLYITGAGFEPEWSSDNPQEFTYSNGVYTFTQNNATQFKISTAKGSWDDFNAGAYGCQYGDTPGVAVALEEGYSNNIVCPWKGDYTITVAGDLSTITLTTTTPAPAEGEITPVYLRGEMNDWGAPAEWELTGLAEGVYTFTCADGQYIGAGEQFKVADDAWNAINYGTSGDNVALDVDYQVWYNGENMVLSAEWDGVLWVDVRNMDDAWVIFSNNKSFVPEWAKEFLGAVGNVTVDSNAAPVYYNLQGVKVNNPENGVFIVVKDGKASKFVK